VAKGNTQTEGCDYFETFSPVSKIVSLSGHSWLLLPPEIGHYIKWMSAMHFYMRKSTCPPPDMLLLDDSRVCKLQKSLYGLKQANHIWYQKLTNALLEFGYTQSNADYTLFFKSTESNYTCLLIYVDDIIISGDYEGEISNLKLHLHQQFHIKDLGKLKYFLGIGVSQSSKDIYISQRKYALDILHEFNQLGAAPPSYL